jgi:hypothetical protein
MSDHIASMSFDIHFERKRSKKKAVEGRRPASVEEKVGIPRQVRPWPSLTTLTNY